MAAQRATITTLTAADIDIDTTLCGLKGSPTKVKKTFTPVHEKNGIIIEDAEPELAVNKLMSLLTDAKLI